MDHPGNIFLTYNGDQRVLFGCCEINTVFEAKCETERKDKCERDHTPHVRHSVLLTPKD